MCVLLITWLLRLVGRSGTLNRFNHTSRMNVVTPTDHPKSVHNRCVIEVFVAFLCCPLVFEFSVGKGFSSKVLSFLFVSFVCWLSIFYQGSIYFRHMN